MDVDTLRASRCAYQKKLSKLLEELAAGTFTPHQLEVYAGVLELDRSKYNDIQDSIEKLVNKDEIGTELDTRFIMDTTVIEIETYLNELKLKFTDQDEDRKSTAYATANDSHVPTATANLAFVPLQDDETFTNFLNRLDIFMQLKGNLDDNTKVFILLHALSPKIHEKLYSICSPDDPKTLQYHNLVDVLKENFDPKPSLCTLQHKFISRIQGTNETATDFATELKNLCTHCKFNCQLCGHSTADMLLKMQFIRGLKDTNIRTKLLQDKDNSTFKEVLSLASTIELSHEESKLMDSSTFGERKDTYQVKSTPNNRLPSKPVTYESQNRDRSSKLSYSNSNSNSKYSDQSLVGKCYRCGSPDHRANTCKFRNEFCRKCDKLGHLAKVCRSGSADRRGKYAERSRTNQVMEKEEESCCDNDPFEISKINLLNSQKNTDKYMIKVRIEGKPVTLELDTGAAVSLMSYSDYKMLNCNKRLYKTNVELSTYTREILNIKGVSFVKCTYKNQTFIGKLYIIDQDVDPLFGRDWLKEIKLDLAEVRVIKQGNSDFSTRLDELLKKYEDTFQGDVKMKTVPNETVHIELEPDVQPIYMKPRPVPYARKKQIEDELDHLERSGIITKIEQSDWGTPIVPVDKPDGSVRICADYKLTLNKVVKDFNYPIPRIEDIYAQMTGGKFFCTLDLSKAYLHLEMDEQSALLQSISTHKGIYRVNRLMFGIKIAPGKWQQLMDKVLQGLEGVQCFFDDIIIQGATVEETLIRLEKVFEQIKKYNLTLNREKCRFFQNSISYLGHVIDADGLHKSDEKVKAVVNTKRPENVKDLRAFLGLANYYNKFIPNLATILNPLNKLLQNNRSFIWTEDCENSFIQVKSEITSERVLAHYDPEVTLVLATDASPVGIGACLSHRYRDGTERPISFASRTLTNCEQKYSQIEKEATAIFWGVKKYFQYLYGRKFILITDNKPLTTIFGHNKALPTLSMSRMFRYALYLSGFDYDIEYKRTEHHSNADYLSRFPVEPVSNVNSKDETYQFQLNQLNTIATETVTPQLIAKETARDSDLKEILSRLSTGTSLETLGLDDCEYSLQDGCILKGRRVMIPSILQGEIMKELHVGHIGIVKMKALARCFCYWKNIDTHIEQYIKSCRACCMKQNEPPKETIHKWESASHPWQRIHIDFAGPDAGLYYFIVVDSYTKWVEVLPTKTTNTDWCIRQLRNMFSTFGIPSVLVSDNGPQFKSCMFETFLQNNNVCHRTSAPYHPATNGQAERFVQTIKKSLKCMQDERGDINLKLCRLLMQLRKVPNDTGECSYTLMFGRNIRTRLDAMMLSEQNHFDNSHESRMKVKRSFEVGSRVQARNYTSAGKWCFGNVIEREGLLHYKIKMDNGDVWRRHVDQLRSTFYGGGKN